MLREINTTEYIVMLLRLFQFVHAHIHDGTELQLHGMGFAPSVKFGTGRDILSVPSSIFQINVVLVPSIAS